MKSLRPSLFLFSLIILMSFHELAVSSPNSEEQSPTQNKAQEFLMRNAAPGASSAQQKRAEHLLTVEDVAMDRRLSFDTSDMAYLFPKSYFKLSLRDLLRADWLNHDLTAIDPHAKPELPAWTITGFRLAPCKENCRARLIVTAQPNGRALMELIFDFSNAQKIQLKQFAQGLQKIKAQYESKVSKTLDGQALGVTAYLEGDGANARWDLVKTLLQSALSNRLPDAVIYNIQGATLGSMESRVFSSALLDDLTAPPKPAVFVPPPAASASNVVATGVAPAVQSPLPIPGYLQAQRESLRTCTGNRLTPQYQRLSAAEMSKGYSIFSRELPLACENRRQFGYAVNAKPVISAEVALQAARMAHDLNRLYIDDKITTGPGKDCSARQAEVVMCHLMKMPAEKCMAMCAYLPTRKFDMVEVAAFSNEPPAVGLDGKEVAKPKKIEKVAVAAQDLALIPNVVHVGNRRFLNVSCVAPDTRAGDDAQGLAMAASIELTGSVGGATSLHVMVPSESESEIELNVKTVTDLRASRADDILQPLSSIRGLQMDFDFPETAAPSAPSIAASTFVASEKEPTAVAVMGGSGTVVAVMPAAPVEVPVIPSAGASLNLRCVGHEVIRYDKEKKMISGGSAAPARRQIDVYSINEGRDNRGNNIGLQSEDELRASIRRASKAQAQTTPKPKPKYAVVEVRRVQHECTKRFLAELKVHLPPAGLFTKEIKPVSMSDLSCVVTESEISF